MEMQIASPVQYNVNEKTITWERLEHLRLQKLGLGNKYSRHFNVQRNKHTDSPREVTFKLSGGVGRIDEAVHTARRSRSGTGGGKSGKATNKNNSIAPFATQGKPTCGFFFSDGTDNRKKNFGIPPSDLVKWRNFNQN